MTELTCWQCGVEPLYVVEVTTYGDPEPVYMIGRWPPGDHAHAVSPPTPQELVDEGYRTLLRIMSA